MSKERKRYTLTEKQAIVDLSLKADANIEELAKRFKVTASTIYNWRSKFRKGKLSADTKKKQKDLSKSEREIAALKRVLKEVELERDILKKAVGIFSKIDGRSSNL